MSPILKYVVCVSWITCLFVFLATVDNVPDEPAVFKAGGALMGSLERPGPLLPAVDQEHAIARLGGPREAAVCWTTLPTTVDGVRWEKALHSLWQAADPSPPLNLS